MNILTSAFPFGYGPTSKMLVIAKQLRGATTPHSIDFVGKDVALTFARQNSQYYDNIITFDDIDAIIAAKYDLAICVMNHYFVIWAHINKMPVIFIDSLFWFWEWHDKDRLAIADDFVRQIRNGLTFSAAMELSEEFNSHELKYVAYQLADTVMTQDYAEKEHVVEDDDVRQRIKRLHIGPIIDTSHATHSMSRQDVFISLAGTLSPLNREPQALAYADLVQAVLEDFICHLPADTNVIMTVNPDLVNKITPRNTRTKIVSLSHDQFLSQLNHSKLLFAPAGVTTIYEAIYYNTPLFFLPEQHDGHYGNYARLSTGAVSADVFPNLLFNTRLQRKESLNPDLEILSIQTLINDTLKDESYISKLKDYLTGFTAVFNDSTALQGLAAKQKAALQEAATTGFDINNYIDNTKGDIQ